MAKGINRVTLMGHVGREADLRSTAAGRLIAQFSMATAERVKNSSGEWVDVAEWHNVVAFGRTAEVVRDFVRKGTRVLLEGRLRTQSWQDKASGRKMYRTEVMVEDLTLLSEPKSSGRQQAAPPADGDYGFERSFEATGEDVAF